MSVVKGARGGASFVPNESLGDLILDGQADMQCARVPLAAVDTAGGVASWQVPALPNATAVIITRVVIDVTAAATGAATVSVGTTATNGTTLSDNLIETVDVHTATGTFDNFGSPGSDGKFLQKIAVSKWVTASKGSGATAGLAGQLLIYYTSI